MKLLPCYMIDILFTNPQSQKLKIINHIKYEKPNIPSHYHLRDYDRIWRKVVTTGAIGGRWRVVVAYE